jgi:DNA end-binding protein Ku
MLHKDCGSRIKQVRTCPIHEKELSMDDIERGYEYAKDEYVVLSEEDFANLPLPSKHTIDISGFVKLDDIDPVYYEKAYYLEADETGLKPFVLLMRVLNKRGLTAVAKIAIRNKERLCALRPLDGRLMLETLYYPDEIRVEKGEPLPDVKVTEKEVGMASSLVDLMLEEFKPTEYHDDYRAALMEVIEAKLKGAEIVEAPTAPKGKVVDLMSALKKSVETAKKKKGAPAASSKSASSNGSRRRKAAAG